MAESFFDGFHLLWYLEELRNEEFWNFKELLRQELLKFRPIPWSELQKASKEDVAALLDKHYPGKQAWEVMLNLFLLVNRRDLWAKGQDEMRNKLNPYKSHMKEKFRRVWEKETCLEVPEEFYKESIKTEYEQLSGAYGVHGAEETPVTVVLHGMGGAGKTTFLRKLMLEWAEGNLWKERFTFVFFLNVYEMNHTVETSLVQLISRDWPEGSEPIEEAFSQPRRILFMIDGFEELKFYLDLQNQSSDWSQRQPTPILLGSLLRRKMLPESSLLLAFGAKAMRKYFYSLQNPQYMSIPGFSEDTRKLYFSHFLRDKYQAARAFSLVKDHHTMLFLLCRYPLPCWLLCSCLKWQLERGEDLSIDVYRNTSLYASYAISVLKSGLKNFMPLQSTAMIKALCALAAEGIWTDSFVFHLGDLQRHGISENEASMWVDMQLLRRNEDRVTFPHLCIQVFFAALWYLLRGPQSQADPTVRSVARIVEATVTFSPSYLKETGTILFGLSAEKVTSMLQTVFAVPLSREIQPEIVKCLRSLSQCADSLSLVRFNDLFFGLYENREEEFVTQVMSFFPTVNIYINNMDDFVICSFCFKHTHNLKELHLTLEHVFRDDHEHALNSSQKLVYWQNFCSAFSTSEDFQVLELDCCVFDNASHAILWKSLTQSTCRLRKLMYSYASDLGNGVDFFRALLHNTHLTYLNLRGSNLSHEQVKNLCEMLKYPFCNIEQLMLGKCDINQASCAEIASVLLYNRKLKLLSLTENPIGHEGALELCKALKQPTCTLEKLLLKFCCLTSATCNYMCQSIYGNKFLSVLDLGSNTLTDEGVAYFCNAMRYPSCVLQELWFTSCYLTPACCKDLSALIISNTNLRTLKLKNNKIEDAGVKELCVALRHPNCKLENLGLDMCDLTSDCCEDLASVLTFGRSLKSLTLDWNDLGDDGVAILCEALSHPYCILELLGLDIQAFEEETQSLLEAVEERNPRLRILHRPWKIEEHRMRGVLM